MRNCNANRGAALLGDLLSVLLAPYDDLGAFSGRIRVAVERMGVGESSATAVALINHELATNSMKYGAFYVLTPGGACYPVVGATLDIGAPSIKVSQDGHDLWP